MSLNLVIFVCLVLGRFQAAHCSNDTSVNVKNHDLSFIVSQNQSLTFSVINPDKNEVVTFVSNPGGIVSIHPTSVQLDKISFVVYFHATDAGKTTVTSNSTSHNVNVKDAFVRVTSEHSKPLSVFSQVIGWIYFVAWSISFYPQIYDNWKRKSVIGLSFDFLALNVIGFTLYSLFNIGLYWITPIQDEYFSRHPTGVNPVQLNDVVFAIHAVFACLVTITQCFIYERGNQTVSRICILILIGIALFLSISLICSLASVLKYLDFLYFCSYVKLFITFIKYVPQAYLNFRRKSTSGWSIGNILLDFTGGSLSIAQMFIISYNENDWGSIFGDPTKFGLGLFSVLFDTVFILQHYVFYRNNLPSEELINDLNDENESDQDNINEAQEVHSD